MSVLPAASLRCEKLGGCATSARSASPSWPERIVRVVLALVLLAMALAWPLLDIGPKGPNLVTFSSGGGSDARDLLSLPVLVLVVVVLWPLRPRRRTARAKRADRGSR